MASIAPTLDNFLNGVESFATRVGNAIKAAGATKIAVEFGCEVGVEAGGALVALLGKATGSPR